MDEIRNEEFIGTVEGTSDPETLPKDKEVRQTHTQLSNLKMYMGRLMDAISELATKTGHNRIEEDTHLVEI